MLKVGFFGHSIASWSGSPAQSFIDILSANYKTVKRGVPQGSEERILVELKKLSLDVAVIFHSVPRYLYMPHCQRDISTKQIKVDKANLLWSEMSDSTPTPEQFRDEFFSYGRINEVFSSPEEFAQCMIGYKRFLYDEENAINRFAGAMMQIDSFLLAKNIFAIHAVAWQPNWVTLKSGVVCDELMKIAKDEYDLSQPNNLSLVGNKQMAVAIDRIIVERKSKRLNWSLGNLKFKLGHKVRGLNQDL